MRKLLIILIVIFAVSIGFHIHRRHSTDFFCVDGKTETDTRWRFSEERYELLEDGFRVERGNFLCYTEEVFEGGYYIHKLRIMGFPVKYRKVDFARDYCWGFPGIPGVDWFKGWSPKGRRRFEECLPRVELYRKRLK